MGMKLRIRSSTANASLTVWSQRLYRHFTKKLNGAGNYLLKLKERRRQSFSRFSELRGGK